MESSMDGMTEDQDGPKFGGTSVALFHLMCKLAMKESIKWGFEVIWRLDVET